MERRSFLAFLAALPGAKLFTGRAVDPTGACVEGSGLSTCDDPPVRPFTEWLDKLLAGSIRKFGSPPGPGMFTPDGAMIHHFECSQVFLEGYIQEQVTHFSEASLKGLSAAARRWARCPTITVTRAYAGLELRVTTLDAQMWSGRLALTPWSQAPHLQARLVTG